MDIALKLPNCWGVAQGAEFLHWDSQQPLHLSKAKRAKSGNCEARSPARLTRSLNIGLSRAKVLLVFPKKAVSIDVRASCRSKAPYLTKLGPHSRDLFGAGRQ